MSAIRASFCLLIGLVTGAAAFAHDPGLSSVHVVRTAGSVEVRLAFATTDLASLTSAAVRPDNADPASLSALPTVLEKSADGMVRLSAGGISIPSDAPVVSAGATGPTEVLVAMQWSQVPAGALKMEFPLLEKMPFGHRMMLTEGEGLDPVGLLDSRNRFWDLPAVSSLPMESAPAVSQLARASWLSFIFLGIEHILAGFDHLCFLFALLLVATRFRDVLTVVTTFTVAHSLTLAAAAFGAVSLSSSIVEPLIAASIIYIGLENLFLRRQPRHRLALVFGFGLIHGLGFAGALAERLPGVTGAAVVPPLLGFNIGVELGQLAVAACLVPLIGLARLRPSFSAKLQPACSLVIAAAGLVWLLQRV